MGFWWIYRITVNRYSSSFMGSLKNLSWNKCPLCSYFNRWQLFVRCDFAENCCFACPTWNARDPWSKLLYHIFFSVSSNIVHCAYGIAPFSMQTSNAGDWVRKIAHSPKNHSSLYVKNAVLQNCSIFAKWFRKCFVNECFLGFSALPGDKESAKKCEIFTAMSQ